MILCHFSYQEMEPMSPLLEIGLCDYLTSRTWWSDIVPIKTLAASTFSQDTRLGSLERPFRLPRPLGCEEAGLQEETACRCAGQPPAWAARHGSEAVSALWHHEQCWPALPPSGFPGETPDVIKHRKAIPSVRPYLLTHRICGCFCVLR